MTETTKAIGSCLCGAVRFTANHAAKNVGACHCGACRKWGGGPLMAVDCGTDIAFEGIETITVYDSSEWAERAFCGDCGSHLFYRLKESGQHIVPAGLLDIESSCLLDHQVFIDEKPEYYDFSNNTKNMTGAELFAQFGATLD